MKYVQLAPKQQQKTLCNFFGANVSGHKVLEDCAGPERLSSPQGKMEIEVGEHQDKQMSLLTVKSRSVKVMQFLHSPEQFLEVITAISSTSFLPHQQPSLGHGVHRAVGQGTNPSLMTTNAGRGFWRGEINQNRQTQKELIQSGFSRGAWTVEPNPL